MERIAMIRLVMVLIFTGVFVPRLLAVRQYGAEGSSPGLPSAREAAAAPVPSAVPSADILSPDRSDEGIPAVPVRGQPLPGAVLSLLIGVAFLRGAKGFPRRKREESLPPREGPPHPPLFFRCSWYRHGEPSCRRLREVELRL